jgi:hypothetical protein
VKDPEDMTPEEIREWDRRQREESRRFAGQPEPRVSRGKRREYQDFYGVPRAFRVAPGLLTSIVKQPSGETTHGRVRGLREVADGGPNVVLLDDATTTVAAPDHPESWTVRTASLGVE